MLRLGTNDDFDALCSIYMHPSVNPYLSFEIMNKEEFFPIFQELISNGTLYVYENSDKEIAATCIVCPQTRRSSHIVCLSTFATNPKYHRQGFGSKFMHALINEIRKDKQIKRIELYAEVDNEIGLNFYKKIGFQIEGCLKKYMKRAGSDDYTDEFVLGLVFD